MTDNKLTDKLSPREMAIFIDAIDRRGWSAEAADYMVQVVAYLRAPVAQMDAGMTYLEALMIADGVMDQYKHDHPKWWKRMDGTPILNDLPVCMAKQFAAATSAPAEKTVTGKEPDSRHSGKNPDKDAGQVTGNSPQSPPAEPATINSAPEFPDNSFDTAEPAAVAALQELFDACNEQLCVPRYWKALKYAGAILAAIPMPGVSPAQENGK